MANTRLDDALLESLQGKTAIVTGGAGGIGAATVRLLASRGANVVIADLQAAHDPAHALAAGLPNPTRAIFVPVDILRWEQMVDLFKKAIAAFSRVDIVVANAGIMERRPVLDPIVENEDGDPEAPTDAYQVFDINLKGTFNTLKLGLHYLSKYSSPENPGSITLVSSTSGYFGGTGVAAYIASKHGVTGLLRASQRQAERSNVRLNAVAPFFTPTKITASFSDQWLVRGLEANTADGVARVIAHSVCDPDSGGNCLLVAGQYIRELEQTRTQLIPLWLGEDLAAGFARSMKFIQEIGGYPLPKN